jgi:hypothetical protein
MPAQRRRCAIYTRKSSEEGLAQDFNSLQAQREACAAFIQSQQGEGWRLIEAAGVTPFRWTVKGCGNQCSADRFSRSQWETNS